MPLFRRSRQSGERKIPEADWEQVRPHLEDDEDMIDACKGWSIGLEPGTLDHPCAVYLTDRALYVDIRPDTLASPETVTIPFSTVAKCGLGESDQGTPRLVVTFDPVGAENPSDIRGMGVDLRPARAGQRFGQQVVQKCNARSSG